MTRIKSSLKNQESIIQVSLNSLKNSLLISPIFEALKSCQYCWNLYDSNLPLTLILQISLRTLSLSILSDLKPKNHSFPSLYFAIVDFLTWIILVLRVFLYVFVRNNLVQWIINESQLTKSSLSNSSEVFYICDSDLNASIS